MTHSNAALNDLFEKILQRDVDPRHLLRLGSGERDLLEEATGGETFSKQGRVEWSLARRSALLAQVLTVLTRARTLIVLIFSYAHHRLLCPSDASSVPSSSYSVTVMVIFLLSGGVRCLVWR